MDQRLYLALSILGLLIVFAILLSWYLARREVSQSVEDGGEEETDPYLAKLAGRARRQADRAAGLRPTPLRGSAKQHPSRGEGA